MKKSCLVIAAFSLLVFVSWHSPYQSVESAIQSIDSSYHADSLLRVSVDSAARTIAPSDTTIGPFKLPIWFPIVLTALIASLSATQFILKRIPTSTSIKIQGVIGMIFDLLTFFQPDKSNVIRMTARPSVKNGIEKPTLRDFQDHK